MKKLYLIFCFFTILSLCSCSAGETDNSSTEISTKQESEYKFSTSVHLLGKDFQLPCKFSELGDLQFDNDTSIVVNENDLYGAIYDGIYRIGRVIISDCYYEDEKMSENFNDNYVYFLELKPDFGFENLDFEYNGFSYQTSRKQIIDAFGTPDEDSDDRICYYLNDNDVSYIEFGFINDSEIKSIKFKIKSDL